MDSYEIQKFLHVAAVVFFFGPTFAFPFLQGFAQRRGVAATRLAVAFMNRLTTFLVYPGVALVALFGVGLIFEDRTGYSDDFPAWLMWAIAWYVVAALAAIFVVNPAGRRAQKLLEETPDGPDLPAAYQPLRMRMQVGGGILGLSVLGILLLMVWKP